MKKVFAMFLITGLLLSAVTTISACDRGTEETRQTTIVTAAVPEPKTETVPAVCEHSWDEGRTVTEATCVEAGEIEYTCTLCGETRTEAVPATGDHSWDEGHTLTEANCVEAGEIEYACTVCGETRTETVPANGEHRWDKGQTLTEPTCVEAGEKLYTCSLCGETLQKTVNALGHAWKITAVTSEVETEDDAHGEADYLCARCGEEKSARRCAGEVFRDMPKEGNWAHKPLDWAYFNGYCTGKTENTIAPKAVCTRAEAVTLLWACAGKPQPETETNPFKDVKKGAYYYNAVLWAVENGVTTGKTAATFAPKDSCTRAQVITMLWAYFGKPQPETTVNPFKDVKQSAYYYRAVLWAAENGVTTGKAVDRFAPKDVCTRAQIVSFLYKAAQLPDDGAIWTQTFPLYFGESKLGTLFCKGNRGYVSRTAVEAAFGPFGSGETQWPILRKQGGDYIALVDAAACYGLSAEFRMEDCSVHLYRLTQVSWEPVEAEGGESPAYIRLEDLMADYGLNGRFTHNRLLQVRFLGDYLDANTDGFYLAWIPCYVNPPENVVNNIAERFNFYNTDFLFTLDSLIGDGGRIGLHGYTHQDHDSVSSVGYEFGPNNEMTEAELLERFTLAERAAEKLGFTWYFFEFPHYSVTAFQREVAEKHFSVIYQRYPDDKHEKEIISRTIDGHTCIWVPTPGDYPEGQSKLVKFINGLQSCHDQGKVMSFFYHPVIDCGKMHVTKDGDTMQCEFADSGKNVLAAAFRLFAELGYRVKPF